MITDTVHCTPRLQPTRRDISLMRRCPLILALIILSSPVGALAASGDTLYVQAERVNLREGPSTTRAVVLQLVKGQALLEFGRKDRWVEVGVEGTGGKSGWIHASLVGLEQVARSSPMPTSDAFREFRKAFQVLNERVERQTGLVFFTAAKDMGDGIIQVTATDTWLSAPKADRESNLRTIFNMWDAAEGSGLPIALYVVDHRGNRQMIMSRR